MPLGRKKRPKCTRCEHMLYSHQMTAEWGDKACQVTNCDCPNYQGLNPYAKDEVKKYDNITYLPRGVRGIPAVSKNDHPSFGKSEERLAAELEMDAADQIVESMPRFEPVGNYHSPKMIDTQGHPIADHMMIFGYSMTQEEIENRLKEAWGVKSPSMVLQGKQSLTDIPYKKTRVWDDKCMMEHLYPGAYNALKEELMTDGDRMSTEEFNELVEAQIKRSTDMLIKKAGEYATDDDRLHNFKVAASLTNETPEQALAGMLVKHIVSIFDMVNSGNAYPIEVWNEKITDSVNYHLILRAMVDRRAL